MSPPPPAHVVALTAGVLVAIYAVMVVAAQVGRLWDAGLRSTGVVGGSMIAGGLLVLVCVGGAE